MKAAIIDGKGIAAEIRKELAAQVALLKENGVEPGLRVILVGDNQASQVYVRNKERACQEVGIASQVMRVPGDITQAQLLDLVDQANRDNGVHGILVQLPLPGHLDENEVLLAIDPQKDVDGFHPLNAGALFTGGSGMVPCTPLGCIELLKRTGAQISGKHAVVVGRSNIVGKPMSMLLLREHATVTVCHSRSQNLGEITRQADILVVAVGRARMITGEMVKPGAVVIDVGMNRVDGKLCGDVDFDSACLVAGQITPVPGGVGPMTIAMLLQNTVASAQRHVR